MTTPVSVEELRAIGLRSRAVDALGVRERRAVRAAPAASSSGGKAEGLHGGMQFTYRNPARSTDPRPTLAGGAVARGRRPLVPARAADRSRRRRPGGAGRPLRVGRPLRRAARGARGGRRPRCAADGWRARRAGRRQRPRRPRGRPPGRARLVRQEHATCCCPATGSWFVLGSVLTDAARCRPPPRPVPDGCGACTRCLDGCPTGAIVAPGVVDARRCLAWLLQVAGRSRVEHRVAARRSHLRLRRLPGGVPAQPPRRPRRPRRRRRRDRGGLGPGARPARCHRRRAAGPPRSLVHRRVASLATSAATRSSCSATSATCATRASTCVAALERYLAHPDPMLRAHAVWAARRLGRDDLVPGSRTTSTEVRDELAAEPPPARAGDRRRGCPPPSTVRRP